MREKVEYQLFSSISSTRLFQYSVPYSNARSNVDAHHWILRCDVRIKDLHCIIHQDPNHFISYAISLVTFGSFPHTGHRFILSIPNPPKFSLVAKWLNLFANSFIIFYFSHVKLKNNLAI